MERMVTRLDEDEAGRVRRLASVDGRSESAMLRRLVVEALAARGETPAAASGQGLLVGGSLRPRVGHPFAAGGPNGRCGVKDCGMARMAAVHGG